MIDFEQFTESESHKLEGTFEADSKAPAVATLDELYLAASAGKPARFDADFGFVFLRPLSAGRCYAYMEFNNGGVCADVAALRRWVEYHSSLPE